MPSKARACPECGSDESTGWSEKARHDRLDIPDEESFDYEAFVREEFGEPRTSRGMSPFWIWVTVGVIALLVWLVLF